MYNVQLISRQNSLKSFELKPSPNDASSIFTQSHVSFEVIDLLQPGQGRSVTRRHCDGSNAADIIGSSSEGVKVRIVSIPGLGTTSPLCITKQLASLLVLNCGVEHEFENVVRSFGKAPNAGHGGCTNIFVKERDDGSSALGYQLQYIEENGRGPPKPWSHRQVGMYHRSYKRVADDASQTFDLFIILHSTFESSFATKLKSILVPGPASQKLYAKLTSDPSILHSILFEECMDHWFYYLEFAGDLFEGTNDQLSTIQEPNERPEILNFEEYRYLRHSRDEMLTAQAYCKGQGEAAKLILMHRQKDPKGLEAMAFQTKMQGFETAIETLLARMDNTIALFQYSLGLQNEAISFATNCNTLDLARTTRDESTEIRIITIVSLVFIPGSFLASWFNMSFFTFDKPSGSYVVADEFELYIWLWLPLTVLTLGSCRLYRLLLSQKHVKEALRLPGWRLKKRLSV